MDKKGAPMNSSNLSRGILSQTRKSFFNPKVFINTWMNPMGCVKKPHLNERVSYIGLQKIIHVRITVVSHTTEDPKSPPRNKGVIIQKNHIPKRWGFWDKCHFIKFVFIVPPVRFLCSMQYSKTSFG